MVYNFRTDPRTDTFNTIDTTGGLTSSNVTLHDFIYDNDTSTISIESSINEVPTYTAYNTTSKTLTLATLTENTTRDIEVTYDVDVITDSDAINNMLDRVAWIWMLICIAFPAAGLAAIWTGRASGVSKMGVKTKKLSEQGI
jgi:hypothetical protein